MYGIEYNFNSTYGIGTNISNPDIIKQMEKYMIDSNITRYIASNISD
jgi:hypothetical protein